MRNSLLESLMVGCGIALGVMLVHTLTQGAPATTQLLALLAAGIVLFCIQLGLALRRPRRDGAPPKQQAGAEYHLLSRRGRRNPFFRELTHDWTGLDEYPTERGQVGPYAMDELDDELWEPPAPKRPKAAAGDQQPRKSD
ncbi:MAG TPA: hypothetical protein VFU22_26880 [Roseiflexaceae bacterium]|nr:hypothetical protein [Roseiflexaceae bacterium]